MPQEVQSLPQVCRQLSTFAAICVSQWPRTRQKVQPHSLGIQIETETMQLTLLQDQMTRILSLVLSWHSKRAATKKELQSTVVQHGRTFLRRMIHLTKQAKQPHHHLRLSEEFCSDLQWWATFLPKWNGKSMIHQPDPLHTIAWWCWCTEGKLSGPGQRERAAQSAPIWKPTCIPVRSTNN